MKATKLSFEKKVYKNKIEKAFSLQGCDELLYTTFSKSKNKWVNSAMVQMCIFVSFRVY